MEQFFATAADAIATTLPEDCAIVFVLTGDGGGTWTIVRHGDEVRVKHELVEPYDCKVTCEADDFRRLLAGELDGTEGYMDGRLAIEGDVGLALGLQRTVSGA